MSEYDIIKLKKKRKKRKKIYIYVSAYEKAAVEDTQVSLVIILLLGISHCRMYP